MLGNFHVDPQMVSTFVSEEISGFMVGHVAEVNEL